MAMGAPGACGYACLMMSREVACFSHKTKGGLLGYPGKPLGRLRLQGEQAARGADHDIVSLGDILHTREDMHRRAGRRNPDGGRRASAGWRVSGLGWLLAPPARLRRSL